MDLIETGGNTYQVRSMTPMIEFHVARRMGAAMIEALAEGLRHGDEYPLYPEVIAWGGMSDADVEFIIGACMSALLRKEPKHEAWAPVWVSGQCMFADINRKTMMHLVREVLRIRIGPFLPEPDRPVSGDEKEKARNGPPSPAAKTI